MAERRWWGWGVVDGSCPASPGFWTWLPGKLGGPLRQVARPSLDAVRLPPSREITAGALPFLAVATDLPTRLAHAAGKSYRDLIAVRSGRLDRAPDAVVFPSTPDEVASILRVAVDRRWAVVPFGGGTSVVGGVDPIAGPGHKAVLCVDLTRMNRLVEIDHESRRATIQAGAMGPSIEHALGDAGYTLGHFPQSFEFSTLGGWVATRSAGQFSTRYGKIERMVRGVRAATPAGEFRTFDDPASATGPEMRQVLIGGEGVLGIIVEATLHVRPKSENRHFASFLFETFDEGIDAVRGILQSGLAPALVRLSDGPETEFGRVLSGASEGTGYRLIKLFRSSFARGCHLLLGTEESDPAARREFDAACSVVKDFQSFGVGAAPGREWFGHRFAHPYLRDDLIDRGVFCETYETSAPWKRIKRLHAASTQALAAAARAFGREPAVLCHLSHAYPDGASLYFTVLALAPEGGEAAMWDALKKTACDSFTGHGGTVTHHHGVGTAHRPWVEREQGPLYGEALKALKARLDPAGVLNPGKLIP